MKRMWTKPADLANAMRQRAALGRNTVLSPDTAVLLAAFIEEQDRPLLRNQINPHAEGSAVYRLNEKGDTVELVAFARSALVARAAFDYLCEKYPAVSYVQQRRAWVEAQRILPSDDAGKRNAP